MQTGIPAEEPRNVLTVVIFGATNFDLTWMAEACALTLSALVWTAGWHPHEEA